jgi:tetratricopeptide (TPR) repeat protein
MEKAFLCHSSTDKDYVRVVANRLGRSKVVFDEVSFKPGHDFRLEIERGLDSAGLFVLIVSRAALDSVWCRYEIDEAHFRKVSGEIRGQLAIIVDPKLTFSDLPQWMQRLRAIVQTRPVQAAREIERELFAITPSLLSTKPFVGRQTLQLDFVQHLTVPMESTPRAFLVSGLEGIGRRAYLSRVLSDNLGLTLGPFKVIDVASTLEDLFVWLLDETAEVVTRVELARETELFRLLPEHRKISEVVTRLSSICQGRFVPCLIDRGAVLDEAGAIRQPYDALLAEFCAANLDHYLALVHTRAPQIRLVLYAERVLQQRIDPLRPHESRLLLLQLLRREDVAVSTSELDELSYYIDGYPPAAYFVTRQAKTYGIATTIADKSLLTDFKAKRFTRFLLDLHLHDSEWDVLTYIASEELVPLAAVAVALGRTTDSIAEVIRKLIDNSLLIVADDNLAVSPPIRTAVTRTKGHLSREEFVAIRDRLTDAFWSGEAPAPAIEVIDMTLHAVARSGATDFEPYRDLVRPSIVHRLARECYYRQEWRLARDYAERAQQMGANNADIRSIEFKALVRLESWPAAEKKLDEIKRMGDHDYLFLKGFILRRRRQFEAACAAYEAAMRGGDTRFALRRDYADCLHRLGRYKEATAELRSVLARQSENIFVLDLALRIYIDGLKDGEDSGMTSDEANRYLSDLERFDVDGHFVHHRKAALLAHQHRWAEALAESEAACEANPHMFEAFAKRCDILIETAQYRKAQEEIDALAEEFGVQKDIQRGLRVKLLIRQDRWREALAEWHTLDDKQRGVHRGLLLRIKELQAQDNSLLLTERQAAEKAVEELRAELKSPRSYNWLDTLLGDLRLEPD